jgi:hypothetical protein
MKWLSKIGQIYLFAFGLMSEAKKSFGLWVAIQKSGEQSVLGILLAPVWRKIEHPC